METVIRAFIHVRGVGHVIGFQRFLVSGPSVVDALVEGRVVKQQSCLDLGNLRCRGLSAIERDPCGKLCIPSALPTC